MNAPLKACLALLALSLVPFASHAQSVIYHHVFDGGDTPLNAVAPDTGPDGVTWISTANLRENGTFTRGTGSVYLPVTLSLNTTYQLTLAFDLTASSGSTSWIALGFSNLDSPPTGNVFNQPASGSVGWFITRQNGGTAAFGGTGNNNQWNEGTKAAGSLSVGTGMQMITTLVIGDSLSTASISMSVVDSDGTTVQVITSRTVDASAWKYLGVSLGAAGIGTLKELTFETTSTIPEPSAFAALAGLFTLGAVLFRRRRRNA